MVIWFYGSRSGAFYTRIKVILGFTGLAEAELSTAKL